MCISSIKINHRLGRIRPGKLAYVVCQADHNIPETDCEQSASVKGKQAMFLIVFA